MMTNYVTPAAAEPPGVLGAPGRRACAFTDRFAELCGHLVHEDDREKFLKDVSAMPLTNGATSVKVGVVRYNMLIGGGWRIPFSLLSSNVAGTANQSKLNSLKLLDPEQGNLNLKWTYAGSYHLGPFCKFDADPNAKGICQIGLNAGLRYMGLEKSTGQTTTATQNAAGVYFELADSMMFPVFEAASGKDAGQLAIKLSATRYRQNTGDVVLFPDARDANGNPLKLNKSYGGFAFTAKLSITDRLAAEASHFRASASNSPIANTTTFSVSYELR